MLYPSGRTEEKASFEVANPKDAQDTVVTITSQPQLVIIKTQSAWDAVLKKSCSIFLSTSSIALSFGIFLGGEQLDNDGGNWIRVATGKFIKFIIVPIIITGACKFSVYICCHSKKCS